MSQAPPRDELGLEYIESLPYPPYPFQEEALLTWFTAEQGVLVCAPTGTGKTLIAEAAMFEALHSGTTAYYTTPLIALTEQKFDELQQAAVRWGFSADDVGLVTGNRRVNPQARVLVVVAEILLNRLLHREAFDFTEVSAVVMDEFHSFSDPERGIVWELSLALLPPHVRLLLLSATVGNSAEFLAWLQRCHGRKVKLVESTQRKVPLTFQWVPDQLLNEQLLLMAEGDADARYTPCLLFCFRRDECWTVAEQLKGKDLLNPGQRQRLNEELGKIDFSGGAGSKLRQLLLRGVGVHHAGLLPKYRRAVERLYQQKLLSVAVCTETLAAGINLPARSVVLTTLVKGPFGKKKLLDPSTAHQIFGRAGRPQYDSRGYVFALAHEDDVRILRWKEKYDAIPEDTKDPGLMKAKKQLKKKRPTRRENEQYWNEPQFEKLISAPPNKLASRGPMPWRLLAYLLELSPDVDKLRGFVEKRLMPQGAIEKGIEELDRMLLMLHAGKFVTLHPAPPVKEEKAGEESSSETPSPPPEEPPTTGLFGQPLPTSAPEPAKKAPKKVAKPGDAEPEEKYRPHQAVPTAKLERLLAFRSVNPVYGAYLLEQFGLADANERLMALESVLGMPRPMLKQVAPPGPDELPPGPLQTERLDPELVSMGLVTAEELRPQRDPDSPYDPPPAMTLANKLRLYFHATYPGVGDVVAHPIWAAGDLLLNFGGDFDKLVKTRDLIKQEGIVFRHLLRLILLCGEFSAVCPDGMELEVWQSELQDLADQLTASCREVDPESTDKTIEMAHSADIVEGENVEGAKAESQKGQSDVFDGTLPDEGSTTSESS